MKIKRLILKNFRQFTDRTFDFPSGIVLLRGSNEAGKTTVCEAAGYCGFGTALLMDPLEKVVTRGGTKASLKVSMLFEVRGVDYWSVRGPSGAELTQVGVEAPLATGQAEVTAKVEELLGVPPGKALQTMFAQQDEIRGILSAGPTATAQFIESLGDFSGVNTILKKLEAVLPADQTSIKVYESEIEAGETRLEELKASAVAPAVITELQQAIAELKAGIQQATAQKQLITEESAQITAEQQKLKTQRETLEAEAERILRAKKEFEVRLSAQRAEVAAAEAPGLKERVAALEQLQLDGERWKIFMSMPVEPEVFWAGDKESLEAEISRLSQLKAELLSERAGLNARIVGLEDKKLTSTVCPITQEVCIQLSSDPGLIEETNRGIDQQIAEARQEVKKLLATIAETEDDLTELIKLSPLQRAVEQWVLQHSDFEGDINRMVVPWEVRWQGPVPVEPASVDLRELNALRKTLADGDEARKFLAAAGEFNDARLTEIDTELAQISLTAPQDLQVKFADLRGRATACALQIRDMEEQLEQTTVTLTELEQSVAIRRDEALRLHVKIAAHKEKIATLKENATILRAARAARLAVMDLLWGRVMGGVSSYFSSLRGVPSTVTRSDGGFLVDGSASRLSGSTLDVLGLALRMTVCKVFSHCGVLLLDEPSHGCDETRTAQMTATLAGAGFDQIILVTHKSIDENVEGSLIEV